MCGERHTLQPKPFGEECHTFWQAGDFIMHDEHARRENAYSGRSRSWTPGGGSKLPRSAPPSAHGRRKCACKGRMRSWTPG